MGRFHSDRMPTCKQMYTKDASVPDRLLDGALQCLREKGYAATTSRDIAASSGANLRSISYHFGSTRELLLAAISLNFRRWLEPLIAAASDAERSPAERLRVGMDSFAEALPENGPVLRAWLEAIALAGYEDGLSAVLSRNQAEFRAGIERTLREGGAEKPEEQAAAIVAVCDGLIVRFLLHGETTSPEDVAVDASRAFELLHHKPVEEKSVET